MAAEGLKRAIRRRYEFIEFGLQWEGRIGRKQLQDQFDISPQQATVDLNSYLDLFSEQMAYDPRQKTYVPGRKFKPRLTQGKSYEYLMQLESKCLGYRAEEECWLQTFPSTHVVVVKARPIEPGILKAVLTAVRSGQALKTRYVSLHSDNETERTLLPHAIASDGHRWHCRSYDVDKERFSDFVLSRLEYAEVSEAIEVSPPVDEVWNTQIKLVLEVDRELGARQRGRLEYEYQMQDGSLNLTVRQAMLYYYLRNLGFDPEPGPDGRMANKSSFHLKIKNYEDIEERLSRR